MSELTRSAPPQALGAAVVTSTSAAASTYADAPALLAAVSFDVEQLFLRFAASQGTADRVLAMLANVLAGRDPISESRGGEGGERTQSPSQQHSTPSQQHVSAFGKVVLSPRRPAAGSPASSTSASSGSPHGMLPGSGGSSSASPLRSPRLTVPPPRSPALRPQGALSPVFGGSSSRLAGLIEPLAGSELSTAAAASMAAVGVEAPPISGRAPPPLSPTTHRSLHAGSGGGIRSPPSPMFRGQNAAASPPGGLSVSLNVGTATTPSTSGSSSASSPRHFSFAPSSAGAALTSTPASRSPTSPALRAAGSTSPFGADDPFPGPEVAAALAVAASGASLALPVSLAKAAAAAASVASAAGDPVVAIGVYSDSAAARTGEGVSKLNWAASSSPPSDANSPPGLPTPVSPATMSSPRQRAGAPLMVQSPRGVVSSPRGSLTSGGLLSPPLGTMAAVGAAIEGSSPSTPRQQQLAAAVVGIAVPIVGGGGLVALAAAAAVSPRGGGGGGLNFNHGSAGFSSPPGLLPSSSAAAAAAIAAAGVAGSSPRRSFSPQNSGSSAGGGLLQSHAGQVQLPLAGSHLLRAALDTPGSPSTTSTSPGSVRGGSGIAASPPSPSRTTSTTPALQLLATVDVTAAEPAASPSLAPSPLTSRSPSPSAPAVAASSAAAVAAPSSSSSSLLEGTVTPPLTGRPTLAVDEVSSSITSSSSSSSSASGSALGAGKPSADAAILVSADAAAAAAAVALLPPSIFNRSGVGSAGAGRGRATAAPSEQLDAKLPQILDFFRRFNTAPPSPPQPPLWQRPAAAATSEAALSAAPANGSHATTRRRPLQLAAGGAAVEPPLVPAPVGSTLRVTVKSSAPFPGLDSVSLTWADAHLGLPVEQFAALGKGVCGLPSFFAAPLFRRVRAQFGGVPQRDGTPYGTPSVAGLKADPLIVAHRASAAVAEAGAPASSAAAAALAGKTLPAPQRTTSEGGFSATAAVADAGTSTDLEAVLTLHIPEHRPDPSAAAASDEVDPRFPPRNLSGVIALPVFLAYWAAEMAPFDAAERFFRLAKRRGAPAIVPTDFMPFIEELLAFHPGLAFLENTPEFQEKYARTVIARIFYSLDPMCASPRHAAW